MGDGVCFSVLPLTLCRRKYESQHYVQRAAGRTQDDNNRRRKQQREGGKCGNSRAAINENRLEREMEKDGWWGWISSEEGRMRGERCDEGLWRPQRQTEDQT